MPCQAHQFNPSIGPLVGTLIAPAGTLRKVAGSGSIKKGAATTERFLIDSGADITSISQKVIQDLKLAPSGKVDVHTPAGQSEANTYLVDIGVPFGDLRKQAEIRFLENRTVIEFSGNTTHYQGLLGRELISQGSFHISGVSNTFTFCL